MVHLCTYGCSARATPIGVKFYELDSDTKAHVRKPLAVNHPGYSAQVFCERADHQAFVQLFAVLRHNTHTQGGDVFGTGTLG